MFHEDLSNPKFLGNTNWVFPINPYFYSTGNSGEAVYYESKLMRVNKKSNTLYATFSETNASVIAEIHTYSKDFIENRSHPIELINDGSFIDNISMVNPITSADYWYKIVIKSDISSIKIYGL